VSDDARAPFIPPPEDEPPSPPALWRIFGTRPYFRLWTAQVISSTGDWIGLIAILAIAARVSNDSAAAVSLVMFARVVPGFFLGTLGGVLIDRFDRRKVMVVCDVGRASMLLLLPFVENLVGLVLVSFALEILTLLWGPAKDASVPDLVNKKQLQSANTLSLVASYATFPVASIVFSLLAAVAGWLGTFAALSALKLDQEALALGVDACTFLASAILVFGLPIRSSQRGPKHHSEVRQTLRDIREGLRYVAHERRVRGVIVGLGLGLIGGGAMIPLGPVFARQALGGDAATFGVLMTALGFGAAGGVVGLLAIQRRVHREQVFPLAVMGTGAFLIVAVSISNTVFAALVVAVVGACAGTAYVTGFTVLHESVHDDLRGRTFATLYAVIRLCLLISLVISPLWSGVWDTVASAALHHHHVVVGGARYAFPGVRLALWGGGLIAFAAGWWARHSIGHAQRMQRPDRRRGPAEAGAT
jgi:MFS family permease